MQIFKKLSQIRQVTPCLRVKHLTLSSAIRWDDNLLGYLHEGVIEPCLSCMLSVTMGWNWRGDASTSVTTCWNRRLPWGRQAATIDDRRCNLSVAMLEPTHRKAMTGLPSLLEKTCPDAVVLQPAPVDAGTVTAICCNAQSRSCDCGLRKLESTTEKLRPWSLRAGIGHRKAATRVTLCWDQQDYKL